MRDWTHQSTPGPDLHNVLRIVPVWFKLVVNFVSVQSDCLPSIQTLSKRIVPFDAQVCRLAEVKGLFYLAKHIFVRDRTHGTFIRMHTKDG